jgi:hypothetical protein
VPVLAPTLTPTTNILLVIGRDNQLKQRSYDNTSNFWTDGPINQANLTVYDADQVGMQACWYGNDYGDVDYQHTPLPGQSGDGNSSGIGTEYGMHMWYASDASTFKQYGWRFGDANWTYQQDWTGFNGHAGVGCYSWGLGTVTYVMFVNQANTVEFWWKDTNSSIAASITHPINNWTNTSIAINGVNPSTSLGYTNYFYAQMAGTNMIQGYNVSWAAENTSLVGLPFTVQGDPGIPGTHMGVSALPTQSGGNQIVVFYQTNGSDITEYIRDLEGGQWTSVDIPIPDT